MLSVRALLSRVHCTRSLPVLLHVYNMYTCVRKSVHANIHSQTHTHTRVHDDVLCARWASSCVLGRCTNAYKCTKLLTYTRSTRTGPRSAMAWLAPRDATREPRAPAPVPLSNLCECLYPCNVIQLLFGNNDIVRSSSDVRRCRRRRRLQCAHARTHTNTFEDRCTVALRSVTMRKIIHFDATHHHHHTLGWHARAFIYIPYNMYVYTHENTT